MRTLFVLGDSISIHYGPYLAAYLSGRYHLDRKGSHGGLDSDSGLDGMNGGTSRQVLDYLEARFPAADLLLLNCGLHDIAYDKDKTTSRVPLREYEHNVQAIAELVIKKKQPCVWVTSTPVDDDQHKRFDCGITRHNADLIAYNRIAEQIMKQAGIPVVDLNAFVASLPGNPFLDHVHYTQDVRQLQGAFLAGYLLAFGREVEG